MGIIGAGWFFYIYPSQHPAGQLDLGYEKDEAAGKADSVLLSWQYPIKEMPVITYERSFTEALDSLHHKWRERKPSQIRNSSDFLQNFPFYYWKVDKYTSERFSRVGAYRDRLSSLSVGLSPKGEVVNFRLSDELVREQEPYNLHAIRKIITDNNASLSREKQDSLLNSLMNYQKLGEGSNNSQSQKIIESLRKYTEPKGREIYAREDIWGLADYYLKRSVWSKFDLERDSLEFLSEPGFRYARAHLNANDKKSGLKIHLMLDLLPAGSLKKMEVDVSPKLKEADSRNSLLNTIGLLVLLSFFIWLLVAFYLRIKARAVDTQPALIIAVVAGFIVPGIQILIFALQLGVTQGQFSFSDSIDNLFVIAVSGAISAIGFFVLTAVSDSVTRQYCPEKLETWDFVRRGIIRNRPVGWVLINGISIGGLLIGIYALSVSVIPQVYLNSELNLASEAFLFPSVGNLLFAALMTLVIVISLFLIISNQFVGMGAKKWIIPVLSGVLFASLDIIRLDLNPLVFEVLINGFIGFILGLFYLKYDFLTIALGLFIYLNIESTALGWMIGNSPDANTFYIFVLLVSCLFIAGILFIRDGKVEEELPEYVPAYLEDQAKEQRVKQELAIARVVQETFLPSQIHHLPGMDIAGICKPAQETGGDYYDMISLGKSRTALAIGDVSGKGIKAAFYMTFTKGVLHSLSAIVLSPVELMNQLNRLFLDNATRGTFISMIYGILEADKRTFTFARAGHNPILLVRKNGDVEWLKPKGVGIGVTKGDRFVAHTEEMILKLKEGDVLVLYTDGITEMMNSSGHFFGEERLERLVSGVKEASSEKILNIIIETVNEFKGIEKQHDDMTVIVLKADTSVNQ